jgi:hypothetical protein
MQQRGSLGAWALRRGGEGGGRCNGEAVEAERAVGRTLVTKSRAAARVRGRLRAVVVRCEGAVLAVVATDTRWGGGCDGRMGLWDDDYGTARAFTAIPGQQCCVIFLASLTYQQARRRRSWGGGSSS